MKEVTKIKTQDFANLIREVEWLRHDLRDAEDALESVVSEIMALIDAEADKWIDNPADYAYPSQLYIKDIAKVIGLDWEDYFSNWKKEHEVRINEKIN